MAKINPYLTFNGNCEEAFNFYKSVFGTEFMFCGKFKDMPADENSKPMSEKDQNLIMHIALPIGKGTVLMGSDTSETFSPPVQAGSNISISIDTESEDEAKKLFDALSGKGTVIMPLEKSFWGALFGMVTDDFGIQWMVNFDYEQNCP